MNKTSPSPNSQPHAANADRPDLRSLLRAMGLRSHRPERSAQIELYRLRLSGLIRWRPRRLEWTLVPEHAAALSDLANGRAFSSIPRR